MYMYVQLNQISYEIKKNTIFTIYTQNTHMKPYYKSDTNANSMSHFLGNSVQILSPRKLDNSNAGFTKWKFMSIATWGEDPRGKWTLEIFDEVRL